MKIRVKSFEEFGGRRPDTWNDKGDMDWLYGQVVEARISGGCYYVHDYITGYTWYLLKDEIEELDNHQSYKAPTIQWVPITSTESGNKLLLCL